MAINKTMEDWFLRGGEKPQYNGMQTVAAAVCQVCGHGNPVDAIRCERCLAPLVGEPSIAEICGQELCPECGHPLSPEPNGPGCLCPRCGWTPSDDDDENDGDDRWFSVTMERTVTVRQTATVRVCADCEESAMAHAEDLAENNADGWDWETVPDTVDYEDCEAVEAEEE